MTDKLVTPTEALEMIIKTLNTVETRGEQNMSGLIGSIQTLRIIAAGLSNPPKETSASEGGGGELVARPKK
jgi:hypothetical protein